MEFLHEWTDEEDSGEGAQAALDGVLLVAPDGEVWVWEIWGVTHYSYNEPQDTYILQRGEAPTRASAKLMAEAMLDFLEAETALQDAQMYLDYIKHINEDPDPDRIEMEAPISG